MNAWNRWLLVLALGTPAVGSCGEETPAEKEKPGAGNKGDGDDESVDETDESEDAPGDDESEDAPAPTGSMKDAGKATQDAGKADAGKPPAKTDAGKPPVKADAGKATDAGKKPVTDKDAGTEEPTEPVEPTGTKPVNATKIADIPDDWREPTCVEVAVQMRSVIFTGGLLDCTGQAVRASASAGDPSGCDPAREICNESVDPVAVTESCEGTQLLVCEEATLGEVKTCLADMKKSLEAQNKKLTCATSEADYLASPLPLPPSCDGVGQSCPALSGLVKFFD